MFFADQQKWQPHTIENVDQPGGSQKIDLIIIGVDRNTVGYYARDYSQQREKTPTEIIVQLCPENKNKRRIGKKMGKV